MIDSMIAPERVFPSRATAKLTVVVSAGQSQNPAKRALEDEIAAGAARLHGLTVLVIENLYDLIADSASMTALRQIDGDLLVLAWLYPRAAHWILDRQGICGKFGETKLVDPSAEDEDEDEVTADDTEDTDEEDKERVIESRDLPDRRIFCLDLSTHKSAQPYLDEIERIAREPLALATGSSDSPADLSGWLTGLANLSQADRFLRPKNDTALDANGRLAQPLPLPVVAEPLRLSEDIGRRWYPVIDFSRCTNCMECIDFCLFGVYGVDGRETILVEQPDNCRKGCPACSRVCPENAIIFPQHKSPAIAGGAVEAGGGGLKIDLSKLFGAPDGSEDAAAIAARERDEQLLMAGRQAVGMSVGIPSRAPAPAAASRPKDDLDSLLDKLDDLDL